MSTEKSIEEQTREDFANAEKALHESGESEIRSEKLIPKGGATPGEVLLATAKILAERLESGDALFVQLSWAGPKRGEELPEGGTEIIAPPIPPRELLWMVEGNLPAQIADQAYSVVATAIKTQIVELAKLADEPDEDERGH